MSAAQPTIRLVNGIEVVPDDGFVGSPPASEIDRTVPTAEELGGFSDTDIANAKRLGRQHGVNIRYTASAGWLVFDGKRWREDERDVRIQTLAKSTAVSIYDEIKGARNQDEMLKHAKRSQGKSSIESMIVLARSEPNIFMELTEFDRDPYLLNVLNGTLDLRTGRLREHARQDYITKLVPVMYDAIAKCELWNRFLNRITDNDTELYSYLRRLVGYLLTGLTTEQVLHFLFGLGANGKSVFVEIIASLLGDYCVVCSPDMIMLRRHAGGVPNDVARLRGARGAFMNETTQGARFDEAKLKDLTGGDSLTARFLHREFFDFSPTHKLVIRGNHKPAISGTDEGLWRRLRLVPFSVQIPAEEQDTHLLGKLRAELPGILTWAIVGCLEWQTHGLRPPACIRDAVRAYREEVDTLGTFITERCEIRALAEAKAGEFFNSYRAFCQSAGEVWISAKELPHELARRGFQRKATKAGNFFIGLKIRDDSNARVEAGGPNAANSPRAGV